MTTEENALMIRDLIETDGKLESPINLDITYMKVIELDPLKWSNIYDQPKKLKLTNTGSTALLSANWQECPSIFGGPLAERYIFSQIHFHWGATEIEGSEHSIDGASMPMELHVVHFKEEYNSLEEALCQADGVAIVVYFFKLYPNLLLNEIVDNLALIKAAESSVRLKPICLANIVRPFEKDYFVYWGSILMPETAHTILWLISRVPIGICTQQVTEFRTLRDKRNVPIVSNRRTLKERQGRDIFYVSPAGPRYASILQIPWEPIPDQFTDNNANNSENK